MTMPRMVSEIRISLPPNVPAHGKTGVIAYVNLTLYDVFAVRDIRIIRSATGKQFVSMPSIIRKGEHCTDCGQRSNIQANFCSECGSQLPPQRRDSEHQSDYVDLIFPKDSEGRARLEGIIFSAYHQEMRYRRFLSDTRRESIPLSNGIRRTSPSRNEQFEVLD